MILRHFPGREDARRGGSADDFACFHRENVVVHAESSEIAYGEHKAPLSIKTCLRGEEVYEVGGVPLSVGAGGYLVLNNGQPYASHICSDETVETFCVFFRDGIEREALAACAAPHDSLLDDPESRGTAAPAPFFQHLRRHDAHVTPLLARLRAGVAGEAPLLWVDEQCGELIEALLRTQGEILREAEALPLVRRTTRLEIYRRLCRARDYAESCYDRPLGLRELAGVACLSQHHFLRLFKAAFRLTPHQYLTRVRLRRAAELIAREGWPVVEVCQRVGFDNVSSFSRLFRRHFGVSPGEMRRAKRN